MLDTFIEELAERGQFNGNILVAEKGEVIYERSIGQRSTTPGDTLDIGAQFRLGSACMVFTALAVMTLEEAGLLSYDDPVEKYISEWPYKGATIRNLLNETSGFPPAGALCDQHWKPELKADDPNRLIGDNDQVIQLFVEHAPEPLFAPGEAWAHSGTGYILLATIVSRISGLPFHQYMREKVFLPAGMSDTYAFSPLREDPLTNRAYGITVSMDGSKLISLDFDYLQSLDGFGFYTTVKDLYALDRVLYTERLVTQSSLSEAYTKGVLNSGEQSRTGFAWSIGETSVSSDGYRAGFGVWIRRDLEDQTAIIILTNYNLGLWDGVNQGVMQILRGEDYELPKIDGPTLVGRTLVTKGEEAARAQYEYFKGHPEEYSLGGVAGLQTLAHFLTVEGYETEAIFACRLNTEQYPGIPHLWDWLGDAYHAVGDTANAVAAYRKAVTIDENFEHALEMLRKLEQR